MQSSQRRGTSTAVLVMDLNGFKVINDTYGHAAGDDVLCTVASRLQDSLRHVDTVARCGGDEFAVVLPDTNTAGARQVAEKIQATLAVPVDRAREAARVGVSIGVSLFPENGALAEVLLERADIAMFEAKRDGLDIGIAHERSGSGPVEGG